MQRFSRIYRSPSLTFLGVSNVSEGKSLPPRMIQAPRFSASPGPRESGCLVSTAQVWLGIQQPAARRRLRHQRGQDRNTAAQQQTDARVG